MQEQTEKQQEQPDKQIFDFIFISLLGSSNPSSKYLLKFIHFRLHSFQLDSIYSPFDVLNEAYLRGVQLINSGKKIIHYEGWIRGTCYNIIREMSRSQRKTRYESLDSHQAHQEIAINLLSEDELEALEDLEKYKETLSTSLSLLQPQEREILLLRLIEELSWEEIHDILMNKGNNISTTSLRQKGRRALERLRKLYISNLNNK